MAKPAKEKRPDSSGSSESAPLVRFAGMVRVDYVAAGRATFSFTSQVSTGELVLRGARGLAEGEVLELKVTLGDKERPSLLSGTVTGEPADDGTLLSLDGSSDAALKTLRTFIEQNYVAKLEESVGRSLRSVDSVLQL